MEITEVARLYKQIKRHYASFDGSVEAVKEDHPYLKDVTFEDAQRNVDKHILTQKFPPVIAEIRGTVQVQSDRYVPSAAETKLLQDTMPVINETPPTEEQLERVRQLGRC